MFVDIYQIDYDNVQTFSNLYRYVWNKLYYDSPPSWVHSYELMADSIENHIVMVLTKKKKSLDPANLIALAEIYTNRKTVEIWNLLSIKGSPKEAKTLLDSVISYHKKAKYFWIAISDLEFPQVYEHCKFDEIECLDVSPLTQTPVSNRRQFILNMSQIHPNEYYGVTRKINISNKEFAILRTVDDGSCFFHAILYAIHSNYNELDHENQMKAVAQFRESLASKITPDLFQILGNGQTAIYGANVYCANHNIPIDPESPIPQDILNIVHRNYVRKIADTRKWAGEENIDLLYHIFRIGVLILTPDTYNNPSIYNWGVPENYFETAKIFVVLWYENSHYDVVVESRDKRSFGPHDFIVNYFKNRQPIK